MKRINVTKAGLIGLAVVLLIYQNCSEKKPNFSSKPKDSSVEENEVVQKSCEFDGISIVDSDSVEAFEAPAVPFGNLCVSQTLTCLNGELAGADAFPYSSCQVDDPPVLKDKWSALTTNATPPGRAAHVAVWTGKKMVIWGGYGGTNLNTGAAFDPATSTWSSISSTNAPTARNAHAAVWSGKKMLVWGGAAGATNFNTGGAYDPAANSWSALSTTGAPSARWGHTAVWTGSRMIVWGGAIGSNNNNFTYYSNGASYDPATNKWTAIDNTNAPTPRWGHVAVWAGSKMIVWGGYGGAVRNDGGIYDPKTNTWAPIGSAGAPAGRLDHSAVFTGEEVIIWGGKTALTGTALSTGVKYHPVDKAWSTITATGAPTGRSAHSAIFTGKKMIIWGGSSGNTFFNTGGIYE